MEALDIFSGKLELLLKKFATLEADNKRLRATIDGQNKVIQRLNLKVRELEGSMANLHLARIDIGEGGNEAVKQQLDAVITEIDKILAKLNE